MIGVCTLLDRHQRDARKLADRHDCPRLVPSTLAGSGEPLVIDGVQERAILSAPGWNESALWLPERGLLVSADALGTTPYFLADAVNRSGSIPAPPSPAGGGISRACTIGDRRGARPSGDLRCRERTGTCH